MGWAYPTELMVLGITAEWSSRPSQPSHPLQVLGASWAGGFQSMRSHWILSLETHFWNGIRIRIVCVFELLFIHNWTCLLLGACWELPVKYGKTKYPTTCCTQITHSLVFIRRLCPYEAYLIGTLSTISISFSLTEFYFLQFTESSWLLYDRPKWQ